MINRIRTLAPTILPVPTPDQPASPARSTIFTRSALAAAIAASLAACASVPDSNQALEQARSRYQAAQAQPQVGSLAAPELARAGEALNAADKARIDREPKATVDHLAYLAKQRVVIAEETARGRSAQAVTAAAAGERDRARLALRTQEADANRARLELRSQEAEATQRKLTSAEQTNARQSSELVRADDAAQAQRALVEQRAARIAALEAQLTDLKARKTERGMVVTLGDVLFETGAYRLRPQAMVSMSKLADFMKNNPQRSASIDGYTDSVGSDAMNLELSERRAHSVQEALVRMGVRGDRLTAHGFGEERPVADNATAIGRQMNRRVEVLFADQAGDPPRK